MALTMVHLAQHAALLTSTAHKGHKFCSEMHYGVHPKLLWSFKTNKPCVHSHQEHITQWVQNLLAHSQRTWQGNSILTLRLGGVPFKEMAMHLHCPLLQALQTLRWNRLTNWNMLEINSRWQNRMSWRPLQHLRQLIYQLVISCLHLWQEGASLVGASWAQRNTSPCGPPPPSSTSSALYLTMKKTT